MAVGPGGSPARFPLPFFRLIRRWIYLPLLLWIGGLLTMVSLVELPGGDMALPRPSGDGSFGAAEWVSVFRLVIAGPASAGFLASMAVLDLMKGVFSWTLPAVRERLLSGQALLGVLLSAVLAVALAVETGSLTMIAVGALGLLAFAVGGSLPRVSSVAAFAIRMAALVLAWKAAPALAPLLLSEPFAVVAAAAAGLALAYRIAYSADAARSHADTWLWYGDQTAPTAGKLSRPPYTAWLSFEGRSWHRPLWKGTLIDWIRAGGYEVFGGARLGRFDMILTTMALFSLLSLLPPREPSLLGAQMTVFMSTFMLVPTIRRGGPYPLSRGARARAVYWSALWTLLVSAVSGFAWFGALAWYQLDAAHRFTTFTWESSDVAITTTVLAPGFLWTAIRYDWLRTAHKGLSPMLLLVMLSSGVFVMGGGVLAAAFITDSGLFPTGLAKAGAVVMLALAAQVAFWLVLRRHFQRGDLR